MRSIDTLRTSAGPLRSGWLFLPGPLAGGIALALIFAFFAGVNAYSMWHAQLTLQSASQAIQQLTNEVAVTHTLQQPLFTLKVLAPWADVVIQVILSVVILVAIAVAHYNPDMLLKPPART